MMTNLPKRKQLRLKGYDYSQPGYYFITICVKDRQNILWDNAQMVNIDPYGGHDVVLKITLTGQMVMDYLKNIDKLYENVVLDCFVIMPNHIHFIIALQNGLPRTNTNKGLPWTSYELPQASNGSPWAATPTAATTVGVTVPKIVNSFKTLTSKKYGQALWQRNYYEHIIRNENELKKIREYIRNNPVKWQEDKYFNDDDASPS